MTLTPLTPPPSTPVLAPHAAIIRRSAQEYQVGLVPHSAVILRGPDLPAFLGSMNGSNSLEDVRAVALAAGMVRADSEAMLAALTAAGLLRDRTDPGPSRQLSDRHVRLVGAGRLGAQVAVLLARSGLGTITVYDEHPADIVLTADTPAGATRAEALVRHLRAESRGVAVWSVDHWSKPETGWVDLTVVAADGPEIDRLVLDHLLRTDQPHLLLRSLGTLAAVGPLVLPGRTSCAGCADQRVRDTDPAWALVLPQLTRLTLKLSPVLEAWATATCAAQALGYLAGELPETAGATLELGALDLATRLRVWPTHPECGCGWSALTEWGP